MFGGGNDNKNTGFLKSLCENVSDAYSGTKDIFNTAKPQAKLTGKMFACCLALNYPFKTQSISLVGFSLGC